MQVTALTLVSLGMLLGGAGGRSAPAWNYSATVSADLERVHVEGQFQPDKSDGLTLRSDSSYYVRGLQVRTGGAWVDCRKTSDGWEIPTSVHGQNWQIRYDFRLAEAGRNLGNPRDVWFHAGSVVSSPGAWLVHPDDWPDGARYRERVTVPKGLSFESGVWPTGSDKSMFEADCDDLDQAPDCMVGHFATRVLKMPGGELHVAYQSGGLKLSDEALLSWIARTAQGVAQYFGKFPMRQALLIILPCAGRDHTSGYTYGGGGGAVTVMLPSTFAADDINESWTLCHELIHLAIPGLDRKHHWLEEGIATYVEPIIRYRLHEISRERYWKDLSEGLENGIPEAGLDSSHSWGSTYWGGALFCFLADVELREATHGKKSLEDALRGVVAAGGSVAEDWPIVRMLKIADATTGQPVLARLYARMGILQSHPDLPALWARLGVRAGGALEAAPEAGLRDSMVPP